MTDELHPAPIVQKLATLTGTFTAIDQVVQVDIPNLSSEAALRLHRDPAPQIVLVMIVDPAIVSVHQRYFKMMLPDAVLPPDFVKYIGQIPFGGQVVNIIEVTVLSARAAAPTT